MIIPLVNICYVKLIPSNRTIFERNADSLVLDDLKW
jgi:hypothetical protein